VFVDKILSCLKPLELLSLSFEFAGRGLKVASSFHFEGPGADNSVKIKGDKVGKPIF